MSELGPLFNHFATQLRLDPKILACIALHESSLNTWATRYEDGFYKKYIGEKIREELSGFVPVNLPTLSTEKRLRATSFGLMQVMGETARWLGYTGSYLTQLCEPAVGIKYGALYFQHCYRSHQADSVNALLAYNGGGDPAYPSKVMEWYNSETMRRILE